jgi:signal transduction histidine kinase
VYAGGRIAASDRVNRSEVGHVLGWGVGGLLLWVAFHGLTVVVRRAQGQAVGDATLPVLRSAGGGLLGGVLLGYLRVDARRDAERAREAQETLEFLNRTLRHEVLNGLNVVQATAGHAEESCDCERTDDPLDTIQSRSDDLAEFVHNIRAFARTFVGEAGVGPVDVGDLLRERYPEAVVAVDVPKRRLSGPTRRSDTFSGICSRTPSSTTTATTLTCSSQPT